MFTVRYAKDALQRAPFGHPLVRYAPSQKEHRMRKRLVSIVVILSCFAFGIAAPEAQALEPAAAPFTTIPVAAMNGVAALDNGGLQVSTCDRNDNSLDSAMYLDVSGTVRSTLQGVGNPSGDGAQCEPWYAGRGREDGTLYGTRFDTAHEKWSKLVAWKNGRELWSVDTTSPIGCYQPEMAALRALHVSSMSEGANGNLYMLLTPVGTSATCPGRLFGVSPDTGAVVMNQPLGDWRYEPTVTGWVDIPTVWTYPDRLVVVTLGADVREFSYNGVENTAAAFHIPANNGHWVNWVAANNDGTIFATLRTQLVAQTASLVYHRRSDTAPREIALTNGSRLLNSLQLTADGSVTATSSNPDQFVRFDLATNTAIATNPNPLLSGYSQNSALNHIEDALGNSLSLLYHASWDWSTTATSVELYDKATNTRSLIWSKESKTSDTSNYPQFNASMSRESIANSTLFLSTCIVGSNGLCSGWEGAQIQKIDIAPFGTPLGKGYKRNSYTSQKLNYVAMGDSFSSGEGNEPFIDGSDTSTNQCHRSKFAYPMLLEKDASLNLNMTAFVACSGAITSNILTSGQNGEPRQLDALTSDTDVVTLTIGGNDAEFKSFMEACFQPGDSCSSVTEAYMSTQNVIQNTLISKVIDTLQAIQTKIGSKASVKVLVIGYPPIISNSQLSALSPWSCLASLTPGDLLALQTIASDLNSDVSSAVTTLSDSRFRFIDPVGSSAFTDHDMCSNDWRIYPYDLGRPLEHIAHPTKSGQIAIAEMVGTNLKGAN